MEYRNQTELRVFHLKRSGGHAIFNWIAYCAHRPVFSINNLLARKIRWRGQRVFQSVIDSAKRDEAKRTWRFELDPAADYRQLAEMPKDVLMWNVENVRISSVPKERYYQIDGAQKVLGASRETKTVLILRDAFNTFASVHRGIRRRRARLKTFYAKHWKAYAREFLGETSFLPADTVKISYNGWFLDEEYRKKIAAQLGFEYTNEGINEVRGYGGGSSFTGQKFDANAQKMDVLNRWKHFEEDPIYRAALDEETVSLSNRIFGDVSAGSFRGEAVR